MYQNADKLLQLDQICNLLNRALFQTSSSQMICDLTVQRRGILGSQIAMNAVDGATIERRICINRPDDENTRCKVSRAWDPRKDFSQPTQPPTTHSTSSAISPQQERTERSGHRPCRRGVKSLPRRDLSCGTRRTCIQISTT